MNRFGNSRGKDFVSALPSSSLDSSDLVIRSKFNFSYFCHQPAGQQFSEWSADQQIKLFGKLHDYSRMPLSHWRNQRVGGGGRKVLEIYGKFPQNSDFQLPPSVPHDVDWGRFRIGGSERLAGFVVPPAYSGKEHQTHAGRFCCNTFYVVFLDRDHRFYKSEDR